MSTSHLAPPFPPLLSSHFAPLLSSSISHLPSLLSSSPHRYEHLHLDIEFVQLELTAARSMLDDLEHNGWPVSDEDFALAVRARALPIEVLTAADARVSDLEARKKHFAEELSEQQQAFIGTMRKLADAADEFRSHLDVEEAEENHTRSNKLLQDLKNAKADGEVINRREGLFGWHITSHEMLSEVEAEITPYSELWEVAVVTSLRLLLL